MVAATPRRALIIGAGPGGLTAAIALRRVGIEAALFERAGELGRVGAGVGLQSNAMRALRRLGIGDRLVSAGTEMRDQQIMSELGRPLLSLPHGDVADGFGEPSVSLVRADVQLALVDVLDDGVLHLSRDCVAVDQDADGVTAHFADGSSERGALLIGADGGRSVVRGHVYGEADSPPRYSGVTIWRSVAHLEGNIPVDVARMTEDTARMYLGRGQTFVAFPIGRQRIYWAVAKLAPEDGVDPSGGVHRMLTSFLAGYPDVTHRIVDATPESEIIRTAVYDRDPERTWVRGRVVLLGDAAHMTTPFIGQGAGISMEDAVVLAKELSLTDGLRDLRMLDVALRAYERERIPRAASVVLNSRTRGRIMFLKNPRLIAVRNALLSTLPEFVRRRILLQSLNYQV